MDDFNPGDSQSSYQDKLSYPEGEKSDLDFSCQFLGLTTAMVMLHYRAALTTVPRPMTPKLIPTTTVIFKAKTLCG